ncbi:sensor histidine kinase [Microbispora sp. NPDC049125]|uniref:sensor histidine kinase n=1 Tax=Microbispora sp. NPDC049125 TaxID=3154929 RepID=UPI0034656B65
MGTPRSKLIAPDALTAAGFAVLPQVVGVHLVIAASWVLSVAAASPLAFRRIWPVPVLAVVLPLSCAALAFGPGSLPAAAYALYTVAVSRPAPRWPPAGLVSGVAAAASVALVAGGASGSRPAVISWVLLGMVLLGGAWTAGRAVAERRENTVRAIEQARLDERLRIAREMHDVVTHSVGLIAVQAGVANHVVATRPEEAGKALTVIEEVSRNALKEMRALLGVLRGEGDGGGLAPSPRLSDLPALAETARVAGVRVELTVRGAEAVPPGVQVAAFRIVQEALSNVSRHAAPTRCRVLVLRDPGCLTVEISDDGPARTKTTGGGYGLVGMRERAHAHGGTVTAAPRPDGGFTVRATLRL